jgi:hypothetical protein
LIRLYAAGKKVVVLIDEAHAMPQASLEEVRLLSNLESNRHKLLQLVLFGQAELDDVLAQHAMRPLRERITQSFRLEPLHLPDITAYIGFRMKQAGQRGRSPFEPNAIKLLSRHSEGLTRRVNILADKALLAAFADGSDVVNRQHAQAAVKDAAFTPLATQTARDSVGGRKIGWGAGWSAGWAMSPRWIVVLPILVAVAIVLGVTLGVWAAHTPWRIGGRGPEAALGPGGAQTGWQTRWQVRPPVTDQVYCAEPVGSSQQQAATRTTSSILL